MSPDVIAGRVRLPTQIQLKPQDLDNIPDLNSLPDVDLTGDVFHDSP